MIKLVAIDMDGTLLSSGLSISNANRKAIRLARENGTKVVLCSGRTIHSLLHYAKELGIDDEDDYIVGYNGAGAVHVKDEKFIYKNCMNGREAKIIAALCDRVDANYSIHTFSESMTPRANPYSTKESGLNNVPLMIRHPRELHDEEPVTKVLVLDDERVLDQYVHILMEQLGGQYQIVRTMPFYLEIMRKNVTKFTGIMAVADQFGFDQSEILAIGDALNDLEIILYAGIGVAMGNAQKSLKDVAKFVTKTNDHDGVAYAMNKFLELNMEEFQ